MIQISFSKSTYCHSRVCEGINFRFVLLNNFAISASREISILKNISTEEESKEANEFHDSGKCLGQNSNKKCSKKKHFMN